MEHKDFAYWLQGFVELNDGKMPTAAQWKSIKEHLAECFVKVTPPLDKPKAKTKDENLGSIINDKDFIEEIRKEADKITKDSRRYPFSIDETKTYCAPLDPSAVRIC